MAPGRRLAWGLGYAALLLLSLLALHALAQHAWIDHLKTQAAHALALAARGDTPYRWKMRSDEDIIAGRVFGAEEFRFEQGVLIVRAGEQPFEIGLALPRTVDLSLFPQLEIAAESDAPAALAVLGRDTLVAPQRELARATFPPEAATLSLTLDAAQAATAANDPALAPQTAMLRLNVALPAGREFRLRAARLARRSGATLDLARPLRVLDANAQPEAGTISVYRLPLQSGIQAADLDAIRHLRVPQQAPLVLLPQRGRVEQQVTLRNAVFAALPGAILIPENALDDTVAAARAELAAPLVRDALPLRWILLALYAAALLAARLRPPASPAVRAALEIALASAGPLWLVLFEPFSGHVTARQWALIALTVAFAASLTPRPWRWNGSARAWILALAVVGVATVFGLLLHDGGGETHALSAGHVSRYLLWALAQQYLICAVCTERWFALTRNTALAAWLGALGFALLHTPNAALMLATFIGGLCWCRLYLRERALLPLALSHAGSALALLALLPRSLLLSAEVSARFFQ